MAAQSCNTACLPSSNSAFAVVHGIQGGYLSMAVHFLGRSAIIATGLFAAGFRGKELVRGSVGGALVMEASLLAWAMFKKREDLVTVPVQESPDEEPEGDGELQPLTIAPVAPKNPNKPPKELPGLVDPDWDLTA